MKHFTQNLRWLFMSLMLVVGVGSAWADTATFDATTAVTETTSTAYVSTVTTFTIGGLDWTATGYQPTKNTSLGLGKGGANYLQTPNLSGNITSVQVTWSGNASYYLALQTTGGTEIEARQNNANGQTYTFNVSSGNYTQLRLVARRSSGTNNALAKVTRVVVTYEGSSSAAATNTSIDASGITNTNLANGTAAGSLSATVTSDGSAISGATVTWSSSNTGVATINNFGVVTLVGAGTTTITASYTGVANQYESSSDTYTLTVTNFSVQDGVFDFTQGYDYGSGLPNDGTNHAANTPYIFTAGNVTMTTSGTGNIAWYTTPNLRVYSGSAFTIAVPDGYVITEISFTGTNYVQNPTPSTGTLTGSGTAATWTGNSQSVTFTRNSQNPFYTVITVTYESASTKTPTSLSWSEATATATIGETNTFPTLTTTPANLTGVTYSSSDEGVATVATDGTVTLVAAGTTTITASYAGNDEYLAADDASYTLTVNPAAGTQPLTVTIGLNNTTYGTSYNGSITPIASFTSASGTISNVTVTYSKGTSSNAYVNDTETRGYTGNTMTFTAPSGYSITSIVFTKGSNWGGLTCDDGTIEAQTWTNSEGLSSVTFGFSGRTDMRTAVVTLATDIPNCVSDLTFTPTELNINTTGTFTPSATEENGAGTIEYSFSCETEGLTVSANGAYTASAEGTYNVTITATPSSSSYRAVSQVVEVTVTDPRAETTTTFPEATYTVELGAAFTAPSATVSANGSAISGATVTYSSSNTAVATVNAETGAVTIIDAGSTTITATYAGDNSNYKGSEGSYVLTVADPNQTDFTWDLTTASYESDASADLVTWTNEVATMTIAKGTSTTSANNYLGGDSNNRTSSRFYNGETLTIAPSDGNTITSIVFEATSANYASALANSTWTNATVTVSGTTVTITPTDGTSDIIAAITGTCGFTGVTVYYTNSSTVARPVITPVSGNYDVRPQTVSITCETEGATIYYTTNGDVPTTSSTRYTAPFSISKNMTIRAIAAKDGNTSRVATSEITFTVHPPVFLPVDGSSFTENYNVTISADAGLTIYYITQDNKIFKSKTGKTADPSESIGELVSTAVAYSGELKFGQSMMVTAICMDADGNLSEPVTVKYTYTGAVKPPYYSSFSASEGDFTATNETDGNTITGNGAPEWEMNWNTGADAIERWGEERYYMYVRGTSGNTAQGRTRWYGSAYFTSPIIDLTGKGSASFSFIHAAHHFYADPNESATDKVATLETTLSDTKISQACKVQVGICDESGNVSTWTDIASTAINWPEQLFDPSKTGVSADGKSTTNPSSRSGLFPRANSGDISLSDYEDQKIRIRFVYTSTPSNYGTWNIDQITVNAVDVEEMTMNSRGWTTYVFDHDIDAYTTTQYYIDGETENLQIFKVTEFDHETCVLQQLGKFEEYTTENNSERYIPAKTPVVIHGPAGATIDFVEYSAPEMLPTVKNNLLIASLSPNTAKAPVGSGIRYFVLQWNNSTNQPWFNKVSEGREIPDHRAYLNGTDQMDAITTSTNSAKGIYVLGEDWEATAIESVSEEDGEQIMNGEWYTLQGVRVDRPTERGIYIVNGKKVLIK